MLRAPIWSTSAVSATSSRWRGSEHLGHERQPGVLARLREDRQRLRPEALEAVGRGARLERAAAQHRRPGGVHRARGVERLLARLDRAGPGDQPEVVAADAPAAHLDDGRLGRRSRRDTSLYGLDDRQDLLDAPIPSSERWPRRPCVAERADHRRRPVPGPRGRARPHRRAGRARPRPGRRRPRCPSRSRTAARGRCWSRSLFSLPVPFELSGDGAGHRPRRPDALAAADGHGLDAAYGAAQERLVRTGQTVERDDLLAHVAQCE